MLVKKLLAFAGSVGRAMTPPSGVSSATLTTIAASPIQPSAASVPPRRPRRLVDPVNDRLERGLGPIEVQRALEGLAVVVADDGRDRGRRARARRRSRSGWRSVPTPSSGMGTVACHDHASLSIRNQYAPQAGR